MRKTWLWAALVVTAEGSYSSYSYDADLLSPRLPPSPLHPPSPPPSPPPPSPPPAPPAAPPLTPAQGILVGLSTPCAAGSRLTESDFVTWNATQRSLVDASGQMPSFASVNIPNLHRIELPAEACARAQPCVRAPTDFEIVDALCSVRQMRGVAARVYVFSHGNGGGFHISGPDGQLVETWFAIFDRVLALAEELGVRLIVPFVNTFWSASLPTCPTYQSQAVSAPVRMKWLAACLDPPGACEPRTVCLDAADALRLPPQVPSLGQLRHVCHVAWRR